MNITTKTLQSQYMDIINKVINIVQLSLSGQCYSSDVLLKVLFVL